MFVVDASIFPGMVTANPSAYIVTVAEHAADKILALADTVEGKLHDQCAGLTWKGSFQCAEGLTCKVTDEYYAQVSFSDPDLLCLAARAVADLRSALRRHRRRSIGGAGNKVYETLGVSFRKYIYIYILLGSTYIKH